MPTHRLRHVRFAGVRTDTQPARVRLALAPATLPRDTQGDVQDGFAGADPPRGFTAWLLARAGLDPADYRAEPLERRVPACLRALKVESEAAAQLRVEANPDLLQRALDVLLIGVTDFFRDTNVFDALRSHVLPALAAREGILRVWSVGCSTGAELHSIAILFAEAGLLDRTLLVGTDCRASAVGAARGGRYPDAALARVPFDLRNRYFTRDGDHRQLVAALRDRIEWRVRDVLFAPEQGPWDLVLCRNVTIYLGPGASHRLAGAAAASLARGGFIVVGRAERLPADAGLAPVARCIYRREA
jgi:chemotaxis methyl-accepting protein methylase